MTLPNKFHGPMHYKIGVTCVYNGHVLYAVVKKHDHQIHLFQNSADRVMNSQVSGPYSHAIPFNVSTDLRLNKI